MPATTPGTDFFAVGHLARGEPDNPRIGLGLVLDLHVASRCLPNSAVAMAVMEAGCNSCRDGRSSIMLRQR
jgi:hypothetical protein